MENYRFPFPVLSIHTQLWAPKTYSGYVVYATDFPSDTKVHCSSWGEGRSWPRANHMWNRGNWRGSRERAGWEKGFSLLTACSNLLSRPGSVHLFWPLLSLCCLGMLSTSHPLPGRAPLWVVGDWKMPDQLRTRNEQKKRMAISPLLAPEAGAGCSNKYLLICK